MRWSWNSQIGFTRYICGFIFRASTPNYEYGSWGGEGGVPTNTGQSCTQQLEGSGSRTGSNIDSATMASVNNELREYITSLDENNAKMVKFFK